MKFFRLKFALLSALLGFAAPASNVDSAPSRREPDDLPTPAEATVRLKKGNARFVMGKSVHPNAGPQRRSETVRDGQHPFATVISCSDSRVPVELIFDAGIGDLFVIRVAGNVCDTNEIGSIEYSVGYLETPLMVVIGHTHCGAVTAAVEGAELRGCIPALVDNIQPAVRTARERFPELSGPALIDKAIEMNVWRSIADLYAGSPETRKRASKKTLRVVGAIYDLETGEVRWLGPHPEEKELLGKPTHGKTEDLGEKKPNAQKPPTNDSR